MKTSWKWVLGIVILLVLVAGVFFTTRAMYVSHSARFADVDDFRYQEHHDFERGDKRGQDFDKDKFHGLKDGFNQRLPKYDKWGYGGYGYLPLPFLYISGLLKKLFPLGVLALVAYIAYQQGKRVGAAEMVLAASDAGPETTPQKKTRKTKKSEK